MFDRASGRRGMLPLSLRWSIMAAMLMAMLFARVARADLVQTLCSSENTGSDFDASQCRSSWAATLSGRLRTNHHTVESIYMSNGRCTTNCTNIDPTYAYAIVQGKLCWCSDYAPANTVPVSQCSDTCVGYPFEDCGNQAQGLFGYLQIGTPAGTQGASSPSSTSAGSGSSPVSRTPVHLRVLHACKSPSPPAVPTITCMKHCPISRAALHHHLSGGPSAYFILHIPFAPVEIMVVCDSHRRSDEVLTMAPFDLHTGRRPDTVECAGADACQFVHRYQRPHDYEHPSSTSNFRSFFCFFAH